MNIDIKLVERAISDDKHAFEMIYQQIYTDLYRMAVYILGDIEMANDAVSETVLDAYKGIKKIKDATRFESWIITILSRKCKKMMRQKYDAFSVFNPVTLSISDEDENCAEKNSGISGLNGSDFSSSINTEDMIDVAEAFKILNEKERMIVSLCIIEGYKSAEVGKMLNMRPGSVRSGLNRALKKMRECLSGKEE